MSCLASSLGSASRLVFGQDEAIQFVEVSELMVSPSPGGGGGEGSAPLCKRYWYVLL